MTALRSSGSSLVSGPWVITMGLALAAVLYVVLVIIPGQRTIARLRSKLIERRQHVMQSQHLLAPLHRAEAQRDELRAVSRRWQTEAPKTAEVSRYLGSVTLQAAAAGVTLQRVDPKEAVDLRTLHRRTVELKIAGSFAAVFDFVRRLEALPGDVWIDQIDWNSNASGGLEGTLTLSIFADRSDYSDSVEKS